jgi:adenine-specific DNA methylase
MTLTPSFIEVQFPVSKLSKESYKERKANHGQTLTGLGKWWGRKPLVLVRASIIGLLLPATEDPTKDRDVFLRLLTMDDDGMLLRRNKNFTLSELSELLTPTERREAFNPEAKSNAFRREIPVEERKGWHDRAFLRLGYDRRLEMCARPEEITGPSKSSWEIINGHCGTTANNLPEWVWQMGEKRFGHVPRVGDAFCGGGSIPFEAARIGCNAFGSDLSPVAALLAWAALNIVGGGEEVAKEIRHSLRVVYDAAKDQVEEWGIERNKVGWIADAYLYCHEVYDKGWLVPLAPSWVIGEGTRTIAVLIADAASRTFRIDIRQGVTSEEVTAVRGIKEGNNWILRGEGTWDDGVRCPVDADGNWLRPENRFTTSADVLRGRDGLRRWENDDLVPGIEDVFQERLYCIRWHLPVLKDLLYEDQVTRVTTATSTPLGQLRDAVPFNKVALDTRIQALLPFLTPEQQAEVAELRARDWLAENANVETLHLTYEKVRGLKGTSRERVEQAREAWKEAQQSVQERDCRIAALSAVVPETRYAAPDDDDRLREEEVLKILRDRFSEWQANGYLPSAPIEPGDETSRLPKERGYTHWHHLFNSRQLLTLGLFAYLSDAMQFKGIADVGCILAMGRMANFNSRLSKWHPQGAKETGADTFANQALNTLVNFSVRPLSALTRTWAVEYVPGKLQGCSTMAVCDARADIPECDIWITDPAYADAINYEELSEFFLAWYEKRLQILFPDWYTDSKRALAVRGSDEAFRLAMVECYRNFASHMPDDGMQIVMFTHTDAEVWADLALILWAAGLRVSQAWTIATETDASGLKSGNYVQGTVLLVLRKQTGNDWGDLSDIFPEVQREVERQMDTLLALDDRSDPNFDDSDYQLAAYAAALRVLTRYKTIEDINVERELRRTRKKGETSPLTELIETAVKIASNYLVPAGIEKSVWRELKPDERLYVKGLEIEAHGDYRSGVYMEFARGYGVRDYRPLLGVTKANQTRLKTPTEFRSTGLTGVGFGETLLRHVLFAVYKAGEEDDPNVGRLYLRYEVPGYWERRNEIQALLQYLARTPTPAMTHWQRDQQAAELLAGMIANDSL